MKVTQEKTFKPVTITIETESEMDYLRDSIRDFHNTACFECCPKPADLFVMELSIKMNSPS